MAASGRATRRSAGGQAIRGRSVDDAILVPDPGATVRVGGFAGPGVRGGDTGLMLARARAVARTAAASMAGPRRFCRRSGGTFGLRGRGRVAALP
jgi:hypothetical protein